jgi:hypothetical protein
LLQGIGANMVERSTPFHFYEADSFPAPPNQKIIATTTMTRREKRRGVHGSQTQSRGQSRIQHLRRLQCNSSERGLRIGVTRCE